jgi:hypothetical protein
MGQYQNIVTAVRNVANAINPTGRFDHGRMVDISQEFTGTYPYIYLYPFKIVQGRNDYSTTRDLIVGFWVEDRPDTSVQEREALISQMDELSDSFIVELQDVLDVEVFEKEPQYQMFNGTLSGYAVVFTVNLPGVC